MILQGFKYNMFYVTSALLLVLSTNTYAKGWDFSERKTELCVVISPVFTSYSQRKIKLAKFGIIALSSKELGNISQDKQDLFNAGLNFSLEAKSPLKSDRWVSVQLTSKNLNVTLDYRESTTPKDSFSIYVSSNMDTKKIIDALSNDEDLMFEFNTQSSGTIYGVVSSVRFKKQFNKFDACYKSLE